jgi:hypothetical protein
MSEDDKSTGLLTRVQRAVRSTTRRADKGRGRLLERVRGRVEQTLAPAIEDAAKKMLLKLAEPDNAHKLQETLAGFAQFAMTSGFRSDPNAALLFDFVDRLEKRHSRQEVLEIVVQHAVVYEQDLLAMLVDAVQRGKDVSSMDAGRFEGFRDRASTRLLTLLCTLAAMDSDAPAPAKADQEEQIAYFEQAPIDQRFKPLARMAAGRADAFETAEESTGADDSPTPGLLRRTFGRFSGERASGKRASGKRASGKRAGALTRFLPSLSDPATRFLTTSYLFFMQSYLVRAMIEQLPEMLAMVRDLERDSQTSEQTSEQTEDVIEVGD